MKTNTQEAVNRLKPAIFLMCLLLLLSFISPAQQSSYVPKEGFVPDDKTAVRIAEAVLDPIYGEEKINSEKPLSARLNEQKDVWIVSGHLPKEFNKGGAAVVEIAKTDGRILRVSHGK